MRKARYAIVGVAILRDYFRVTRKQDEMLEMSFSKLNYHFAGKNTEK